MRAYHSPEHEREVNKLIPAAKRAAEQAFREKYGEMPASCYAWHEEYRDCYNRAFHTAMTEMAVERGLRVP